MLFKSDTHTVVLVVKFVPVLFLNFVIRNVGF
jgi:hypothetical protein